MLLEEYSKDKISAYIKAERYINNGSPSGFSKNTTSFQTSHKSNTKEFLIYEIAFGSQVVAEDFGKYKKYYHLSNKSMLIHPDSISSKYLRNEDPYIINYISVVPTSSGRTVLFRGDSPFFIKLAYPGYLGRVSRDMHKNHIMSALEVSQRLESSIIQNKLPSDFSYFKEDAGRVVCFENTDYQWGVVFREFAPYPYSDEEEYLIPFFSLFSKEIDPETELECDKQDPFLLSQLFDMQNESVEAFLLNQIDKSSLTSSRYR